MRRNETKRLVLQACEDFAEAAPADLFPTWLEYQYATSLSQRAVSMCLLRCHRMGLLFRKNGKYQISPKGEERLQWLRTPSQ